MNEDKKMELADKLGEYPLLRILILEKWFRYGFILFVLVLLAGLLMIPKIWVTSPPGFIPVVKISLLDRVQAWSLKRTARAAVAAGRFDEAQHAWFSAFANNQSDTEALHGLIHNFIDHEESLKLSKNVLPQALWLLRLTGTNLTDLEMVAPVFERTKYFDYLSSLLELHKDKFTPSTERIYLRALFEQGNYPAFDRRWQEVEAKASQDAELQLYRDAFLAGWGPPITATDALARLKQALEAPERRILATRLHLLVSAQRGETAEYERLLKQLEEARADSLPQHLLYWKLLLNDGRKAQAIELAQSFPHPPASPGEAIELARFFVQAGLRDRAAELFKRFTDEFNHAPAYWIAHAGLLIDDRRWNDLRELAVEIRSRPVINDMLAGLSYYLEGRAELGNNHKESAEAAFQKMVERSFQFPEHAFRTAYDLVTLGFASQARDILLKLEPEMQTNPRYWGLLFAAAEALRQTDLMLSTATRARELQPGNPSTINNYAATLLICRQKPEEAIRLTLELLSQSPNSPVAKVNHAGALLLNGRPKEAEALLSSVSPQSFTRPQLAILNLNLFDLNAQLNRRENALAIAERIEQQFLYPTQREWLAGRRAELEPKKDDTPGKSKG